MDFLTYIVDDEYKMALVDVEIPFDINTSEKHYIQYKY